MIRRLLLILLCIPLIGLSQQDDIIEVQQDIMLIESNLESHWALYNDSKWLGIIGFTASTVGGLAGKNEVVIVGGIVTIISYILEWRSHKLLVNNFQKKIIKSNDQDEIFREHYLKYPFRSDKENYVQVDTSEIKVSITRYDFVKIVLSTETYYGVLSSHGKDNMELFYMINNNAIYRVINYRDILEIYKFEL